MNVILRRHWWIVNVAAGVVGIIAMRLAEEYFPSLAPYATMLFLTLVGLSFLWVFTTKKGIWWAVAPGVGAIALAVAVLVSLLIPENNGWVGMLILGAAAFLIAAIPNVRDGMKVAYIVGAMTLVIGFLMAPIAPVWKIILCIASAALGGYFIWRNRETLGRVSRT